MKILLLMTTGMSLKKWDELGQLSRELSIYQKLGEKIGHVYIHSYGKNEEDLVKNYPNVTVLSKFNSIPEWHIRPKRISEYFNYLYNFLTLFLRWRFYREIDSIKTNQFRGALWGVVLKRLFGCKLVTRMGYYHSHFKRLSARKFNIEKQVFRHSDIIIVTEPKAGAFLESTYDLRKGAVQRFPNYIDVDVFKTRYTDKDIDILYVGRLGARKNLEGFLRASKGFSAKIMLIGKGPLKERLIEIATQNNIDLRIIERVNNYQLPEFYNRTKIFVLPSLYEGNPKALLEAMACGCAVIGSNVNGINNIIHHKVNGYVCETDIKSIANAIREVLKNQSLRKKMGLNARKYIEVTNASNVLINREARMYSKMVNESPKK